MQPHNHIAFKEWAVICAALGEGRQCAIVRKGGIHEGREGFRVAYGEFWLFPTYLHEQAEGLVEEAGALLERVVSERPADGLIHLAHYAVVTDVFEVRKADLLTRLAGQHLWSHRTLDERFHYRQPGLFVLTVRVYRREEPYVLPDSPHFGGCRSWVELPDGLSTAGLQPVLGDEEFARQWAAIRTALSAAPV